MEITIKRNELTDKVVKMFPKAVAKVEALDPNIINTMKKLSCHVDRHKMMEDFYIIAVKAIFKNGFENEACWMLPKEFIEECIYDMDDADALPCIMANLILKTHEKYIDGGD